MAQRMRSRQRRQIRVSRSLEGRGERPATGYGEPEAGAPKTRVEYAVVNRCPAGSPERFGG